MTKVLIAVLALVAVAAIAGTNDLTVFNVRTSDYKANRAKIQQMLLDFHKDSVEPDWKKCKTDADRIKWADSGWIPMTNRVAKEAWMQYRVSAKQTGNRANAMRMAKWLADMGINPKDSKMNADVKDVKALDKAYGLDNTTTNKPSPTISVIR